MFNGLLLRSNAFPSQLEFLSHSGASSTTVCSVPFELIKAALILEFECCAYIIVHVVQLKVIRSYKLLQRLNLNVLAVTWLPEMITATLDNAFDASRCFRSILYGGFPLS